MANEKNKVYERNTNYSMSSTMRDSDYSMSTIQEKYTLPMNQGLRHNDVHSYKFNKNHHMKYRFNRKRNFCCVNCGKEGHVYKECKEPITSFGIIAIQKPTSDVQPGLIGSPIMKERCQKHLKNIPDSIPHPEKDSKILYLMIQRKDTMGYIDFIRGKYPESDNIEKMRILKIYLQEMTCVERNRLLKFDFDTLWDMVWMNKNSRLYINEYIDAKQKFNRLNIEQLLQVTECCWTEQEYGFPKGRKNMHETNLQCARREFDEETGYTQFDIKIISDKTWEEIFIGTNGVTYRHVYFIAEVPCHIVLPKISLSDIQLGGEISNIGWFTFDQCIQMIRPYDVAKKELLMKIHEKYQQRYVDP